MQELCDHVWLSSPKQALSQGLNLDLKDGAVYLKISSSLPVSQMWTEYWAPLYKAGWYNRCFLRFQPYSAQLYPRLLN